MMKYMVVTVVTGIEAHPVSAVRFADIGQLALWIDFADTAPSMCEIHIALLIHDDAGAGMSRSIESRQGELRGERQKEGKYFHKADLTWLRSGMCQRIVNAA